MFIHTKIRRFLKKGKNVDFIAKKLGINRKYVHTIRREEEAKFGKPKAKPTLKMRSWVGANKPQRTMINLALRKDGAIIDLYKGGKVISPPDLVNHPPHYKAGGIETIDFIESKDLNYRLGNVVKYVSRAGKKDSDPVQDLEKAAWYLQREIDARKGA